eukprot:CAMPEP_0182830552 /NCGR_PEP_ID=MMETSP0006_2-20121128/18637_1 /TAXON_ID=97485 /ORGANISM="Prymnesium parvum, Strain Texoma1" /LENGTH=173 /DNA_ID=CAMNT_0024958129 /DNA_START=81 /DNA_END=598 /DNA_ORIENTATION=-
MRIRNTFNTDTPRRCTRHLEDNRYSVHMINPSLSSAPANLSIASLDASLSPPSPQRPHPLLEAASCAHLDAAGGGSAPWHPGLDRLRHQTDVLQELERRRQKGAVELIKPHGVRPGEEKHERVARGLGGLGRRAQAEERSDSAVRLRAAQQLVPADLFVAVCIHRAEDLVELR